MTDEAKSPLRRRMIEDMTLVTSEFIRRFLIHVLPLLAAAMTMDLVPLGMFALHLAGAIHR
jgi:hypothetical protein